MSNFQSYENNLTVSYYIIKIDTIPKYRWKYYFNNVLEQSHDYRPYYNHCVVRKFFCFKPLCTYIKCVYICD